MAQCRVTEYYGSRKRTGDLQPTKRRKVQRTTVIAEDTPSVLLPISKLSPTASSCSETSVGSTRSRTKKALPQTRSRYSRRVKNKTVGPIEHALLRLRSSACETEGYSSSDLEVSDTTDTDSVASETTAISDDHDTRLSPPLTPTKRTQKTTTTIAQKRRKPATRINSLDGFDYFEEATAPTPAEFAFELQENQNKEEQGKRVKKKASPKQTPAKKKLELKLKNEEPRSEECSTVKLDTNENQCEKTVTETTTSEMCTSLKYKPSTSKSTEVSLNTKESCASVVSAKLKDKKKVAKLKEKMSPAAVKDLLSKSGKLAELQSRLAKVKEQADKTKKLTTKLPQSPKVSQSQKLSQPPKAAQPELSAAEASDEMPAYQKYHSLATPVPPSLNLPYKYKILSEMFRSVDTIVGILQNRTETCTFTKLKEAVQEMIRRTFELKNLGQIKTVYPYAYTFRQERGVPTYKHGVKSTDYQLTIDASLDSTSNQQEQRQKLTSSKLIQRRNIFDHSLVDIVKVHHKDFLSKLIPPLTVPEDKLTRWHPKFPLDRVPDIEPASLPEPPNVKKYSSAKDVLDKARDMLTPRVTEALEKVAKKSELERKNSKDATPKVQSPNTTKNQNTAIKGVPQSLLERIRAKEAAKMEAALIRDPAEDKKTDMIARLPELCRILRGFFLAEKKAAIPIESATSKLVESYKSCISVAQMEKHLDVMSEVLPQWLSIFKIRKTTYVKIDKKTDMNTITDKINEIVKQRK
ncbi:DNA replication factor Cdt1-like [Saccoglossus kowalevskii]|uniref:DNA replication factor Cdt1-like n=1 Tax=Saccoglossus kowalevskii TaxID=10224 RepID=A0ABM0H049_SACKO|nr:PREDICTED: DNA replication factor Cdt1-like [Saccoglossus kowalevskii]